MASKKKQQSKKKKKNVNEILQKSEQSCKTKKQNIGTKKKHETTRGASHTIKDRSLPFASIQLLRLQGGDFRRDFKA
jgi:hypothetical protein